jgi:hypothetical protein
MSRQAATPAATLSAVMLKNIDNQTIDGEEKSKPEVIKLGLDLHAWQVTECRQLDGSTPKPAQQWDPWKLLDNRTPSSRRQSDLEYSDYDRRAVDLTLRSGLCAGLSGDHP